MQSTLGCLIQGGVLINGVLINGGVRNSQKPVFTLSTGDKCILRVHCNDFFLKRKHLN